MTSSVTSLLSAPPPLRAGSHRRARLGLATLLGLLGAGALLPWLSVPGIGPLLPGAATGQTPLPVMLAALLAVAALGVSVVRQPGRERAMAAEHEALLARCETLEAARDADEHAALHDPLTGSANRRQFERRLERLVADEAPAHALLMIDLDRFKPVNDLHGHAAGDALLKDIAAGLARLTGPDDLVARLGGDEFAVLLSGTTSAATERCALSMLEFVTRYRLNWQDQRVSVGTSIGIAAIDRPGLVPAAPLATADNALYAAKEAGRGAVFYQESGPEAAGASDAPPILRRIDAGTPEPVSSARSHEPEDGRRQELHAMVMASLAPAGTAAPASRRGSRQRKEIAQWIAIEPLTVGDSLSPGTSARELLDGAATRADGGADLARWMLIMALDAASRLSAATLGRTCFVLPIPARAVVAVPGLAEELLRMNALAHRPVRHLTLVLQGVAPVYDNPALAHFHRRMHTSGVRLGFEIRASTLDVLAPLRHTAYDELHLGRELVRNLRPGSSGYAAVETLLTVAERSELTLVASGADSMDAVRHLGLMGVDRFAGPVIGSLESLHTVLSRLDEKA